MKYTVINWIIRNGRVTAADDDDGGGECCTIAVAKGRSTRAARIAGRGEPEHFCGFSQNNRPLDAIKAAKTMRSGRDHDRDCNESFIARVDRVPKRGLSGMSFPDRFESKKTANVSH